MTLKILPQPDKSCSAFFPNETEQIFYQAVNNICRDRDFFARIPNKVYIFKKKKTTFKLNTFLTCASNLRSDQVNISLFDALRNDATTEKHSNINLSMSLIYQNIPIISSSISVL